MRIAVTHDNGQIFQHFGRSEEFKVYEVENGEVLYSEVVDTYGSGHSALALVLAQNAVDILICGGIGGGAQSALAECGIAIYPGISGSCDEAVEAFLRGEIEQGESNCNHHHEGEEHHCCHGEGHAEGEEHHCCHGEGHHEGGCCGRHQKPAMEGPNVGKTCRVHYRGTFNDGTQFDSSYDRGQTLDFVCGAGMMISGFDKAVATMEVGQIINVHLMPEEAYGPKDPNAIFTVNISDLPGSEDLEVGQQVYLTNSWGQPFMVTVTEKNDATITFDANSEMAGKELNFQIELVEVTE